MNPHSVFFPGAQTCHKGVQCLSETLTCWQQTVIRIRLLEFKSAMKHSSHRNMFKLIMFEKLQHTARVSSEVRVAAGLKRSEANSHPL